METPPETPQRRRGFPFIAVGGLAALAVVGKAMGIVRQIYKDLVAAAQPESARIAAAAKAVGPAPAYLTNQIANYQAALARLGG